MPWFVVPLTPASLSVECPADRAGPDVRGGQALGVGSEVVGWSDGEEGVMTTEDNKGVERTGMRGE